MDSQRKKYIFITIGILVSFFLFSQLWTAYQHRGLVKVRVAVLPSDSRLTVDSVATKPGSVYLKPGSHTLTASRADFDNDTKAINTNDITKDQIIYMLPAANSAVAKDYLLKHPDIQRQRESAGGAEAERVGSLLAKKYPFISKLPQENLHYKIDYELDSSQNLSLTITTFAIINGPADYPQYQQQTKNYRQEALEFLQKNNIDQSKYKITYIPGL